MDECSVQLAKATGPIISANTTLYSIAMLVCLHFIGAATEMEKAFVLLREYYADAEFL